MMSSILPRISIIVATYNAEQVLDRCLQSIAAQSCRDWELIVIDGGSTDGTVAIIQSHAEHIAYWHSRPDAGIYDAWNQALPHARGDYICFLGADDALHSPDTIKDISAAVGDARYDLITCRGQIRNASGLIKRVIGASWQDSKLPRHFAVCHPGLLHHRSIFERHGVFDYRYKIAADLDFLLRLPSKIQCLDLPIVTVDIQDDGISRSRFWLRIMERRMIHSKYSKIGPIRAWIYWIDKAWRRPIALLLGLPH